jgi:hypothetical protein
MYACCERAHGLGDFDAGTGAAAGATVGSVVPVVGTTIGGIIGAIGGALAPLFGSHAAPWTPATCPPATVNARVGSDGWWYDLSDGHQLTHQEASARCAQVGAVSTMRPNTGGVSLGMLAVGAGVLLTGVLLVRQIGRR